MAIPAEALAGLDEPEGDRVPGGLPPIVDAHVHVFPDRVFAALRRWFGEHGWPIRYQPDARGVIDFLLGRGVRHLLLLHYAHKPGMARSLNAFAVELAAAYPGQVTGLATVLPGELGARQILEEAFAAGLRGVKLHAHVQCLAPDQPSLAEVYEVCAGEGRPIVFHAGREPRSQAYACDPHQLCSAERVERVLRDHPRLKLVVPHLGSDEETAYERLLERHDNLWLDSTMMLAGFFPGAADPWPLLLRHPGRVLYGTDFPNLPYAWDRELRAIAARRLPPATLEALLGGASAGLFGIDLS
jgi:predicted TIM-barrel fold metal-dependent hydrolase